MSKTLEILRETLSLCALNKVAVIKFTATDDDTKVQAHDDDKTLYIDADIAAAKEFTGVFGISDLKMLSGLLNFNNHADATFKSHSREIAGKTVLDEFQFRRGGTRSSFKLMAEAHIPKQVATPKIPWAATMASPSKEKLADFLSFAGMYAEVDKTCAMFTQDGKLMMQFGLDASSTHSGVFEFDAIAGETNAPMTFPVDKFVMLMKLAVAREQSKLMLSNSGVLGVEIEGNHGVYRFYLRQSVR